MSNGIECAFPAGDESDDSSNEWDIGYACNKGSPDSEITDSSVPGNNEDSVSTLKRAINVGDVQTVQQLLDSVSLTYLAGMDVETRLSFEWTPLMCAVHVAHCDLAKLLLDRGANANFSRDHYTVLMAACTAVSATEEKISKCVELLLTRNADPNAYDRSHMTCVMLAARDGYTHVINLLVSHGAEVNAQDVRGHTALTIAVQYGHEKAVLKLLQLGADKSVKTKAGKTAADLAFKKPEISRILASPRDTVNNGDVLSKTEALSKFFKRNPQTASKDSISKLCDIELLLHGLNLDYLSDTILKNDVTWSDLLTMEKEDLEKIGVTDPEDQRKVLSAVQEMHLDKVELETLTKLDNIDTGSEELYNFLISLRQQCCYLTETVQDVISRFPRTSSELVLTRDPRKEAQAICAELVIQAGDLQKEVTCLKELLSKMDPAEFSCQVQRPSSHGNWKKWALKRFALGMLGAGLLLLFSQRRNLKFYF